MCKRPISLRNPSTAWNYLNDTVHITVPCGHCSDCENKSRFDWQVRVYYEYLRCHDIGGFTVYATMTYDDQHLPLAYVDKSGRAKVKPRHREKYLSEFPVVLQNLLQDDPFAVWDADTLTTRSLLSSEIEPDTVMSCFSKADCQRFAKNVDSACGRRGEKFGYMISSEYGHYEPYIDHHGRQCIGSSRPHYHGLFFFDGSITPKQARKILEDHWKEFGTIEIGGKNQPYDQHGIVCGAGAIGYVCKYIQKSRDNAEALRKHLLIHSDSWLSIDQKRLNRNFSAFHIQSYGLGLYCLDVTEESLLKKGKTKFPMYDPDNNKKVCIVTVDLPTYLERKKFCFPQKEVPNRAYIYNSEGVRMRSERLKEHRDALVHEIKDFLELPQDYITNPDLLKHINHNLGRRTCLATRRKCNRPLDETLKDQPAPFLRPRDFANAILKALDTFTVENMVDYALLFQGLIDTYKLEKVKNGQYVYLDHTNLALILKSIDDNSFLDYSVYRLTKDRSIPYSLDKQKTDYYSKLRLYIPELEKALRLYSAYTTVLASGLECATQDKIAKVKRKELYYLKSLYGYNSSLVC